MIEVIRSGNLGQEGVVRQIRANGISFGLQRG